MIINFSNNSVEGSDIKTNLTPDTFINRNGITFSKCVLEDLNYSHSV